MSEFTSKSSESATRIVDSFKCGLANYKDHWQEWITPMVVAALVAILSLVFCFVPFLLVLGPLACALYCCAFAALQNREVTINEFNLSPSKAGNAILASVCIDLAAGLPMLMMIGCFFVSPVLLAVVAPPPPTVQENAPRSVDPDSVQNNHRPGEPHGLEPEPPLLFMVLGMGVMLAIWVAMFVGMIATFMWQLWITTRLMFALPLIAEKETAAVEAIRQSWCLTRSRIWELLAINAAVTFLMMAGLNLMYVGLLFTLPMGITIRAVVYQRHLVLLESGPPD